MNFNQAEFGQRIRELRRKSGLTQDQLSEDLNISVEQLRKMECGTRRTSFEGLISLAMHFDVSTDFLLMGRDYMNLRSKKRLEYVMHELSCIISEIPENKGDL